MVIKIRPFKEEPLLIHLHMPKTGGTTLKNIITKNYGKRKSVNVYVERRVLKHVLRNLSKKRIDCIQGHMPFGVHQFFDRQARYVTMLRDPVDRVLSEYYFIQSIPTHKLHAEVVKMSLEEYQNNPSTTNLQTHYILGEKFGKSLSEEDLKKAKNNLKNHFLVAGLTERFEESIVLMKEELGWDNINYTKVNVTKNRLTKKEISKDIIVQIEKNNLYDMELYQFAKELFEQKINSLK
ncbi:sulfotransferase family 2 domain-containing protein [Metabacillus arenae]|uniref:Sulfotransferase family 2 domain-containing protein n=1 Tax=Metabacillus arenae TaxID=2771434 RepID=A0A926RYC4_9BACI|nr:sulfotransferase family 2 domain-containing protein [Metabacillus arenae]MBD1381916.1 sulfotransferase family 2 domain-containing protein [Metabacillus arenae]